MPVLKQFVEATYPEQARKDGLQAVVVLGLTIDKTGKVTHADVRQGAGHGFDEAAMAAGQQLRFEPARTQPDGKARAAKILFKYEFVLEESDEAPPPPQDVETIAGTVELGDAPLAGVTVSLTLSDGSALTAVTDEAGKFAFINLPGGTYQVSIESEGYKPFNATEEIAEDEAITVVYRLRPLGGPEGGGLEVTIEGERPDRVVTRRTIQRREINRIPGTKGDALRSLENMPGVARPPPFSGLLIVRGSAPEDSQYFIDGAFVPLIYHFGGLASVVPTDMLEHIDFFPGNFGSEYGRGMGGIVNVELRSPRTEGYHGLAQADFIDGRLQLEGPIPWLEDWGFLMAGRRSWVDAVLTPIIESSEELNVVQTPRYYDYQFLVENKPDEDSRFRMAFYGSDDGFAIAGGDVDEDSTGEFDLAIAFQRAQVGYQTELDGGHRLSWNLAGGRDSFDLSFRQTGFPTIFVNLEVFSLSNQLRYSHKIADWLRLNVGGDFGHGNATVTTQLPVQESEEEQEGRPGNTPFDIFETESIAADQPFSRPAAFMEAEITPLPRWQVVPGLRVDYTASSEQTDVSPRFNTSYGVFESFPQTTFKAGIGLYYQPPTFLQFFDTNDPSTLESSRAVHYGVGVKQDLTREIDVSVEGFVKQLDGLVVTPDDATQQTNDGTGYVVGGELFAKYKPDQRFFGWLAYTLSRSARRDAPDEPQYLFDFDQTHVFTILGSYRLGGGWEFGARFRVVSGNLITPAICNPEDPMCDTDLVHSIYHAPTSEYVAFPKGAENSERLPLFHQLDMRIDRTWTFSSWKFGMYLDVTNVYNHQAAEGVQYSYDLSQRQYFRGLPLLPSLGLRAEF